MIYFMYNYVQQKEKIDKDQSMELESDSSSPDRGCKTSTGGSEASSLVSSNSPSSLQSPGSRSSLSDNSGVSPYGLLQMVNTSFTLSYRKYCVSLYWEYSFSNKIFSIVSISISSRLHDQEDLPRLHLHPRDSMMTVLSTSPNLNNILTPSSSAPAPPHQRPTTTSPSTPPQLQTILSTCSTSPSFLTWYPPLQYHHKLLPDHCFILHLASIQVLVIMDSSRWDIVKMICSTYLIIFF